MQNIDLINEAKVADLFQIKGTVISVRTIGNGYIHSTYLVETVDEAGTKHRYTMQKINTNVFRDPVKLMANYEKVTAHLAENFTLPGSSGRSTPRIIPTKPGESFCRIGLDSWRMLTYFSDVYTMNTAENAKVFYYAGKSFGQFILALSDIPNEELFITIPNFHNTPSRYRDLEEAIGRDEAGRVKNVLPEIEFVRRQKPIMGLIAEALESGKIPTRITHNDTNLNNILFDSETDLPVAVIDLDTVMPSSPLYDFGDSIRIGTNTACDDDKDLSHVSCDLTLFESYARGYLEACGKVLTKEELDLFPYAARIITLEDGIRFLMDYIKGDVYYRITRPDQNLDRARTQLRLVADLEKKDEQIRKILGNIRKDLGL